MARYGKKRRINKKTHRFTISYRGCNERQSRVKQVETKLPIADYKRCRQDRVKYRHLILLIQTNPKDNSFKS